eukprot:GHUV01011672.1.p1 GENE.GHUV01011672.1~~GHUV01011672.1.p1  ORF type:complete len:351 (+),score=97.97 GHUV01011672.1:648-1700(+)
MGSSTDSSRQAAAKIISSNSGCLPLTDPSVQYFYLKTSPLVRISTDDPTSAAAPVVPLKVHISTEADILAHQQQQGGILDLLSNAAQPGSSLPGCDVFCSVSSSQQQLGLSLVSRSSAGVDNLFVGVTGPNHTRQRGLQIPCFGWRQWETWGHNGTSDPDHDARRSTFDALGAQTSTTHTIGGSSPPAVDTAANNSTHTVSEDSSDSYTPDLRWDSMLGPVSEEYLQHASFSKQLPAASQNNVHDHGSNFGSNRSQQDGHLTAQSRYNTLWQTGDLVQLVVDLGSPNKLLLKVNGGEVQGCYDNMLRLPSFQKWCWYVALFRGSDVVAVVFERDSYSIYSGDQKLTRYIS